MEDNSIIYGLEFQARSLVAQLSETETIRFLIGTQSLKQNTNQVHLVEFNEENSTIKTTVFQHKAGEIWRITSDPGEAGRIATCYNTVQDSSCLLKSGIFQIPKNGDSNQLEDLEEVTVLETASEEVKTTEFHPSEASKALTVTESKLILWDVSETNAKSISSISLEGKHNPKFTTGKWNPHQNCNQFTTATEGHLKTYDLRSSELAWSIEGAHAQLVRDLDYNMNKQYHLATCGDDAFVRIWDFRQTSQPVFCRSDHSHWVWTVRFNHFHDQLLLTASSDARVLLSSAASVSSEMSEEETKQLLPDGPLQWCEHEDSVYCAEWSPADPWIFASLSYDGRLLISRVKKSLKYQIML